MPQGKWKNSFCNSATCNSIGTKVNSTLICKVSFGQYHSKGHNFHLHVNHSKLNHSPDTKIRRSIRSLDANGGQWTTHCIFDVYLRGGVGRWGARRAGGWWAPGRSPSVGDAPRPASFYAFDSLSSAPHRSDKQTQPLERACLCARSLPPSLPSPKDATAGALLRAQYTQAQDICIRAAAPWTWTDRPLLILSINSFNVLARTVDFSSPRPLFFFLFFISPVSNCSDAKSAAFLSFGGVYFRFKSVLSTLRYSSWWALLINTWLYGSNRTIFTCARALGRIQLFAI